MKRTGNCTLSKKFEMLVRRGPGTTFAYPCAKGRKAYVFSSSLKRNTVRLKPWKGSFTFCTGTFAKSSPTAEEAGRTGLAAECFPETAQPDRQSRSARRLNIEGFMSGNPRV